MSMSASISFEKYESDVLMVHVHEENNAPVFCILGFGAGCDQKPHYVGLTIEKGGKAFDFDPVNIGYVNNIDRVVAFAVPTDLMVDSKVYMALWSGEPKRTVPGNATLITNMSYDGSDIAAQETQNPIAQVGQGVLDTAKLAGNIGQYLPYILLGIGAIVLLNYLPRGGRNA